MNVAHCGHVFIVSTPEPSGLVRKGLGSGPISYAYRMFVDSHTYSYAYCVSVDISYIIHLTIAITSLRKNDLCT